MKNFIQRGDSMNATAPSGGVVSGNVYKIGDLVGVASINAAEGIAFDFALAGVFELPKAAQAIAEGQKVYWSTANQNVTTTPSGNTLFGHAIAAVADVATKVMVRLSN